jgi:hypothetical protein
VGDDYIMGGGCLHEQGHHPCKKEPEGGFHPVLGEDTDRRCLSRADPHQTPNLLVHLSWVSQPPEI